MVHSLKVLNGTQWELPSVPVPLELDSFPHKQANRLICVDSPPEMEMRASSQCLPLDHESVF